MKTLTLAALCAGIVGLALLWLATKINATQPKDPAEWRK